MTCNHTCIKCGELETGSWSHNNELITEQLCFGCNFWRDQARDKDSPFVARIGHVHYRIGPNNCRGFAGHGGRRFDIRFNDGREVITNNLWCQGDIPEHFHDELPDNATFMEPSA